MSGAYVVPVDEAATASTNAPRELEDPKVTGDVRNQVIGTKRYNPEKWLQSLSAVDGRPMPVIPVAVTMIGSAVILAVWVFVGKAKKGEVLVDSSMHTFIGLAAFFLLSFRANASYDRWYEGRKQWGMVINRTRDLARQFTQIVPDDAVEGGVWRRALGHIVAFAVTMKRHLRDERGLMELRDVLSQNDVDAILASAHMPLHVIDVLGSYVEQARRAGKISDIQSQILHDNLTGFEDYLGASERIKKTPMPFGFVVHLRSALVLWTTTLPLVLWSSLGWAGLLATLVVSYLILAAEQMSTEIENPFGHDAGDLPLGAICDTIKGNIKEILARAEKGHASLLAKEPCWK